MYYRNNGRSSFQNERDVLEKINFLKSNFGEKITKPKPEDFDLTEQYIARIRVYNEKIIAQNHKLSFLRNTLTFLAFASLLCLVGIINYFELISLSFDFEPIFYFVMVCVIYFSIKHLVASMVHDQRMHPRTGDLNKYEEKISIYPSENELTTLYRKVVEISRERKERDYWFSLDGHQFEEAFTNVLKKFPYRRVVKTRGSGDGGVDIIITKSDGDLVYLQCKAHKKPVGPEPVRALRGVAGDKKCALINLGGFTVGAMRDAQRLGVKLLDVNDVLKICGAEVSLFD